jgi:hypothetical protein
VCKKQNPLTPQNYIDVLVKREILEGKNTNLQLYKGVMSKITMSKNVLTPIHTKYQVVDDFSTCIPLRMVFRQTGIGNCY